jgi:DNA-binding IclR family transcriptional regulator
MKNSEETVSNKTGNSLSRMLSILELFNEEHAVWSAEDVAKILGTSRSTSYRYFKMLTEAGLLSPLGREGYILGPAIIELDRLIRFQDPLTTIASPVMKELARKTQATVLLARFYKDKVICTHNEAGEVELDVAFERGRPMSLFLSATSRTILAQLPTRQKRRLFELSHEEISQAGQGDDWPSFRRRMREIRKAGYCTSVGEVDPGYGGIAAPILNQNDAVEGSLTMVFTIEKFREFEESQLADMLIDGTNKITAIILKNLAQGS